MMYFEKETRMLEQEMRVICFFGILLLLGCGTPAQAKQERALPAAGNLIAERVAVANDGDRPVPAERNPRYRICRDDILLLSFPLSPELNQRVIVQPDGFVALQGAGSLYVAGLTLPGVVEAVKKAYVNMLHDPIVDVDLADFQKPFFTVLGQVGKPGQYDLRYDITVTQAVAVAGGFTQKAKTQVFLYRAVSTNWAEVRELKLKDILQGKNISEDMHLRPGDMIYVPEKFITKFQQYVPYTIGLNPYVTVP